MIEQAIFPILTYIPARNIWKCMGTGFFINPQGGFVTAKHVFLDGDRGPLETFYGVQTTQSGERHVRVLKHLITHDTADICVGMFGPRRLDGINVSPEENLMFSINSKRQENNTAIKTYAFPSTEIHSEQPGTFEFTFQGRWSEGLIEDFHPDGSPVVRNPCYQTSMHIEDGASGGPVVNESYEVIGVNSSGMDVEVDADPLSFITPIDLILDLKVPSKGRMVSIRQLIASGHIVANSSVA